MKGMKSVYGRHQCCSQHVNTAIATQKQTHRRSAAQTPLAPGRNQLSVTSHRTAQTPSARQAFLKMVETMKKCACVCVYELVCDRESMLLREVSQACGFLSNKTGIYALRLVARILLIIARSITHHAGWRFRVKFGRCVPSIFSTSFRSVRRARRGHRPCSPM